MKDPLLSKQTLFASVEEKEFFRSYTKTPAPLKQDVLPALPMRPLPKPVVMEKPQPKKEPLVSETSTPPPKKEQPRSAPPVSDNYEGIKSTLNRIAPHLALVDEVPDDAQAKKLASAWKEKIPDVEVILLACQTDNDTLDLLKSLGKAIDQHLGRAKILPAEKLEKENRWDLFLQKNPFRLIVASDGLKQLPQLMRFYHAVPAQSQAFLDKIPLLELSSATFYKAIENKAHLWKLLCHILKK